MNSYTPPPDARDVDAGKTVAILSYCTLIGWIVAIILHSQNKTRFGAYHLRQGLGLYICFFALGIIVFGMIFMMPFLFFLPPIINLGLLVLLILGLVNAVNGKTEPVPLLGETFARMLAGLS